jgi:hypothetical protein
MSPVDGRFLLLNLPEAMVPAQTGETIADVSP